MFEGIKEFFGEYAAEAVIKVLVSVVIATVGLYLVRWLVKLLKNRKLLKRMDPSFGTFLLSCINITLKIAVIVSAAAYLGVPMASVTALIGSAGLALGLALQGGLSNLASGLIILLFKPFSVEDYISVGEVSGTVAAIGMFYSSLRTDAGTRVVYPNSMLTNKELTNYTVERFRRADMIFSVAFDAGVEEVKQILNTAVQENRYAVHEPEALVYIYDQNENELTYRLLVWAKTEDYFSLLCTLREEVNRAFLQKGIDRPRRSLDICMKTH